MSAKLSELGMQLERLDYESKEGVITIDILREQNQDLNNELEEVKKALTELRASHRDPSYEDKEKKKAEKMAMMMAQFDTVCP
jgi:kinesin family member 5